MAALWANERLTFPFYETFSNGIPKCRTFVKEIFYSMLGIQSNKMTAFGPNGRSCFTFYDKFRRSFQKILLW